MAGESWNSGPEQERLNDVAGARLRITTLRAAAGPAVEFLEYLHPRDGRSLPPDARANDLAHWQTIMTGDVTRALPTLPARASAMISRGLMAMPSAMPSALGFAQALAVRDPDGHAVQLRSRPTTQ